MVIRQQCQNLVPHVLSNGLIYRLESCTASLRSSERQNSPLVLSYDAPTIDRHLADKRLGHDPIHSPTVQL